jgi:hypothetical protein
MSANTDPRATFIEPHTLAFLKGLLEHADIVVQEVKGMVELLQEMVSML